MKLERLALRLFVIYLLSVVFFLILIIGKYGEMELTDTKTANVSFIPILKNEEEDDGIFRKLNSDLMIYSTYFDIRSGSPVFRSMAIVRIENNFRLFCYFNGQFIKAHFYEMCENHDRTFGSFIISCHIKNYNFSSHISSLIFYDLTSNKTLVVPVTKTVGLATSEPRNNFTVCVHNRLHGMFYSRRYIAEFVELSKLLGAQHFILYLSHEISYDTEVMKLLRLYERKGTVTLLDWPLEMDPMTIWENGQSALIQDCLYRTMDFSKFTLFHDLDEYFVPAKSKDWNQAVKSFWKSFPNASGFHIEPLYFFVPAITNRVTSLAFQFYETTHMKKGLFLTKLSKCLVKPERIFEMGIHHISKQYNEIFTNEKMDPNDGRLHHYSTKYHEFGESKGRNYDMKRLKNVSDGFVELILREISSIDVVYF